MNKLLLGFLVFCIGHTLAWFQYNSQFVWKWWEDKPLLTVSIYAIPAALCFWFATKLIVGETGALWSSRLLAFSASYLIFPVLTWYFAKESMLEPKTLICVALSLGIIAVQLGWKT